MTDPQIVCPQCSYEIKLTESLAAPLVETLRRDYEARLQAKDADVAARVAHVQKQEAQLRQALADQETRLAAKLQTERTRIAAEEAKRAREHLQSDLQSQSQKIQQLQRSYEERGQKLAEAQKAQVELLRKSRELEDARRELDLTVEKRITEGLAAARQQALAQAEDSLKLRVAEKQQTIDAMQRQIEDLKRRAEQGSQQLQGEVQELELEAALRARFVHDVIEPVPKGQFGGDCVQHVLAPSGMRCGSMLWESKRTKHWTESWLQKLREDARAAHADVAIIVSVALPKGVDTFDLIDGVWVAQPRAAVSVATALRQLLIDVARARVSSQGQQTKSEMMYQYLTGSGFRHRVQAMVERLIEMQDDLDRERRAMMRMWSKRETQLRAVVDATAGMYGDLQGIAGKSMQEIDGLGMKLLEPGMATH